MIRVRIELLPGGYEDDPQLLGEMLISNNLVKSIMSDGSKADYDVEIWKKRRGRPWRELRVKNWPRRAYHPWELVRCILNEVAITSKGGRV